MHLIPRGYRAIFPQYYVIRSDEQKRKSLVHTAAIVPSMFVDGSIRTKLSILAPLSARRWETLVGIDIRLADGGVGDRPMGEWELRVQVRKPWGTIVKKVKRQVTLTVEPTQLFERIALRPGRYDLDVVLSHPREVVPRTATAVITVPDIPEEKVFIVGPVLGQPFDGDVETDADDPRWRTGIEPLVLQQAFASQMLTSFINVCHVGKEQGLPDLTLQRILGLVLAPLAWLMGVPWHDAVEVGGLLGIKTVLNEFIAYGELAEAMKAGSLAPRSALIASYALCGFANFGSLAILLGGIGGLAPTRRGDVARLGLRSILAGSLATFMTACVAGMLL